jgi:hypothetical protein
MSVNTAERYPTAEIAHIEIYGRIGRAVARLKNISSTGAFLELNQGDYVPKKGDLIRATIHLHSLGKSRAIDAEIVWNRGVGFGVCFLRKTQLLEKMFQRSSTI